MIMQMRGKRKRGRRKDLSLALRGGGEGGRDVHSVVGAHAKKGRKSISLGACNCEREWAVEMRTCKPRCTAGEAKPNCCTAVQ